MKILAQNKKAYHDYHIEATYEAGIMLLGTEVKSIKAGKINLRESYARFKGNELYLVGCHVSEYSHGNINNHDPLRDRKLLLHKEELHKISGKITQKGLTLIPLKVYLKDGLIKLEIGLAKGKKHYDKRESIKKREAEREIDRMKKLSR
jgi:SsrA-binding protein